MRPRTLHWIPARWYSGGSPHPNVPSIARRRGPGTAKRDGGRPGQRFLFIESMEACRVNPLAIGVGATPGATPGPAPGTCLVPSTIVLFGVSWPRPWPFHATRDMLMRAAVAVAVGAHSPGPWTNGRPCEDAGGSSGAEVLVQKPAEAITALHRAGREGDHICRWPGEALVEPLMGVGPVVVVDELRQHALQVPPAEDQEVIQALAPRCADKSLSDRVRPRRSIGQAHNVHAFRAEDLVECGRELGVPVSEQELLGSQLAVLQLPGQVARLLEHPGLVGAVGAAGQVNATAADLDEEEHVDPVGCFNPKLSDPAQATSSSAAFILRGAGKAWRIYSLQRGPMSALDWQPLRPGTRRVTVDRW